MELIYPQTPIKDDFFVVIIIIKTEKNELKQSKTEDSIF